MEISGRSFVITGGASGLGAGTARMLASQGGRCIIADVNASAGAELAQELGGQFVRCDVTSPSDAAQAIAAALQAGPLGGLINCAGIAIGEKTVNRGQAHDFDRFQKVITINLIGTFNMIRTAAAAMVAQAPTDQGERGVIINTASVAAYDGQIGQAAYAASKGGVVGMTLPIARDLARDGIRVVTIAPGIFETPMMLGMPQEVQDALGRQVPFPSRLGKPAEYAKLVQAILENPMLNGETIRLDGAIRMPPK